VADGARPRRLYCAELPAAGGSLTLGPTEARHAKVLRLSAGDPLELFDARGGVAEAHVSRVARGGLCCEAGPRRAIDAPARRLQLVVGLPKGGKLDVMVRMLTELGVSGIHLAQCARSVPRPADHAARLQRLQRVAIEACGQSGQAHAPLLHALSPLGEVAARAPQEAGKLVFWEQGGAPLPADASGPAEAWAVTGPEGGLDAAEVAELRGLGYTAVGLGPAILRAETAAVVAAALLLDRLGRLR
jgi:16S rRNA (uracil1498-N3)-methyltransferase